MPKSSKQPKSGWWLTLYQKLAKRRADLLARRSHRSFRLTKRRDYVKELAMPGYTAFTAEVCKTVWRYRRTLLLLVLLYAFLYMVLVGAVSQDNYTTLISSLKTAGGDILSGNWGGLGTAGILLVSLVSPQSNSTTNGGQEIFGALLSLMMWLSVVWFLRNSLAGHRLKLRDALYNSGAPLFASIMLAGLLMVQLMPIALALVGYSAAETSGLLSSGVAAMLCWAALLGLAMLSIYWIISTLFALVIITLPGTYPYKAIRIASDMVLGRRFRIMLRIIYMVLVIVLFWLAVMIPVMLLDMWLGSLMAWFQSVPLVPVLIVLMTAVTIIWSTTYVYLLYRKVVDSANA